MESDECLSWLVSALEAEMKQSGVKIDCSALEAKMKKLKDLQESTEAGQTEAQTLNVGFNTKGDTGCQNN